MKLVNGTVQVEPGERAVVVEDHGFMFGVVAVIVYRHHRCRVYHRPSDSTLKRIRRHFKESGDFARLRSSGPVGPKRATPYLCEYWVHPGPWKLEETAEKASENKRKARKRKQKVDEAQG
jgi:hypothetical protein